MCVCGEGEGGGGLVQLIRSQMSCVVNTPFTTRTNTFPYSPQPAKLLMDTTPTDFFFLLLTTPSYQLILLNRYVGQCPP